ncbi:MAG: DUF6364 family protein [Desulfuromusa sp.]
MPKTRINISLDQDLADFAKTFALENRTTVAEVMTQYLLSLKRRIDNENTESILCHPAFQQAMEQAQQKLTTGSTKWDSYDEVFKN